MFRLPSNLYAPAIDSSTGSAGGAIEDKALEKSDVIELLGEESDDEETLELGKTNKRDKPKKDEGDKEIEETDETEKSVEDEIEDELSEEVPTEDQLELTTPVRRREILAKYPTLFKDFPYLEKAYYREQKYSEILPTIEDAQNASNKAELLDNYEQELLSGSSEGILRTVKEGNAEAFNKIVDNYLPSLHKVDEGAYYHIVGNIVKHTIMTMIKEGQEGNQEDLVAAANVVNQYVFGTKEFTPPSNLAKAEVKNSREDEINSRERDFNMRQFESHYNTLDTKVANIIKSTIDKNIDPNDSMTDYVKRTASREVLEGLESAVDSDVRFKDILDRLWELSKKDNFSNNSLDRIKSAYLSKAKTILPEVIKKARNEALKGLGRKVQDSDDSDRKGPLPVGQHRKSTSSISSGKTDKDRSKDIPKGMKSIDFLMQD